MSLEKDNDAPRSSRRANGSLLSVDRTPQSQSEDFFTDSLLDASKIPTPSPKKQPFHKAYKERRAIGNSRALKSAWQSSGRGSFSDSDGTTRDKHHLRPTELPSPGRTPSPLRQINRTSTPPAEASPTTPSVLSSPAHGLDETYKRIAEEEDIAAQEGELGDEEEFTDEMWNNGAYGESFHPDDESQTDGQNSEADNAYDHGPGKENVPLEDGTAPTDVSGMSFLQGLTDQNLAAKLTPHAIQAAKDRVLLERAAQRQTPINFKVNKNGPSLSERLRRRSTEEGKVSPRQEELERPSSAVDDFHEPSPNVPKSWTKQKPGRDWMQRSRQKREQGRNGVISSPVVDSSQVDWAAAAAADVPLPSVEDSSTPRATNSRHSSPASLHSQRSLDRIRHWEMKDFTGQSLQVSDSPPVRPKANVADQIQQREIERLEQQAVTTSRLGQYRKRDPNELIKILSRQRSSSSGVATNTYPTPETSATPPASGFHPRLTAAASASASSQESQAVKFAEDGESVPTTPVGVSGSSSTSSNGTTARDSRPGQDRSVSEDRLARLARAMSNSPKPSSILEGQSVPEVIKQTSGKGTPLAGGKNTVVSNEPIGKDVGDIEEGHQKAESSRQSSKQFADPETTPKANQVPEAAKTPKIIGAWTDTILPDTILRTFRKQKQRPQHADTPHISAGGWIETPLPGSKRQSSAMAPIPIEEEEEAAIPEGLTNGIAKPREENKQEKPLQATNQTKAEAPSSALTSLLERAKSRLTTSIPDGPVLPESNDTLHLNDSTINSLEDLLTLDNAELTTLIRMGAESEAREQLIRDHLGAEPIAEAELLERLGGKLERLRTNIHDARRGIGRLEHQVAATPDGSAVALRSGPCKTCGTQNNGYVVSLHLPFTVPHLLHQRKPGQTFPRPTWLGWLTILAWAWYIAEQAMADRYSHPIYANTSYTWPSEPEPTFPLVLPTMLWRWSGRKVVPGLLGPVWWLLVAIFRAVGQALGWTDGFVDDGMAATHGPSVGQMLDVIEDAAGMGGDEFM